MTRIIVYILQKLGGVLSKKVFRFFIAVLLIVGIMVPGDIVYAGDIGFVRVGLKSLYWERSSIEIKNKKISMGYCENSTYNRMETFSSNSGFKFMPDNGSYYVMDKSYRDYESANKICQALGKLSIHAYPVSTAQNKYLIYIGGGTEEEAKEEYNKAKGKYGYSYRVKNASPYRIKVQGSTVEFIMEAEEFKGYPQFQGVDKDASGTAVVDLGDRKYKGRIEIGRYDKKLLTVVNTLYIEDYIKGVVPCEMPSSWHMDALKAQAVCARSYALANSGYKSESSLTNPFDLSDSTNSQMYKGYNGETDRTNSAVAQTKGQTLRYNNKTISPYYYSTSGGRTESVEDVWSKGLPYLRSEPDLYENEPGKPPWQIFLTGKQIEDQLRKNKIEVGNIKNIYPEIRTQSGRVYSLKIEGIKDSVSLQSNTIRTNLGLYSTKFKLVKQGDIPDKVVVQGAGKSKEKQISNCYVISGNHTVQKASSKLEQFIAISQDNRTNFPRSAPTQQDTYLFAGQGYGHGVGMSQSGANGMAKAGYNYVRILKHYFKDTKVVQSKG